MQMVEVQRYDDLATELKNLAAIMSETNTTVARMEEKLNYFQTMSDMKMERERDQSKQEFASVYREVNDLKAFKKEHEQEHRKDDKDKHRYLLGVIVSVAISLASIIWNSIG